MMQLIGPVADLSETLAEWTEFTSVRARLTDILCLDREGVGTEKVSLTATEIVFNAVSFAYGEENVLENLSFSIPSGSHVAIVGPSGAGKSTVFSLLMKYYTDYRGDIRVGGHSLSSLSSGQVRQLMSYIPQDNTLFHGTLRDNLLYGKNSHVTEERLRFILDELGLSQLLAELEDGLDTVILENGSGLSEGQKQRFSIARALLLEHSIYLMDEVTASLDSVTEQEVSQAIDRLTAGKTRLTIAHRLHTVREADLILVFDKQGKLVDCGNHQQLSKQNALYQDFLRTLPRAS